MCFVFVFWDIFFKRKKKPNKKLMTWHLIKRDLAYGDSSKHVEKPKLKQKAKADDITRTRKVVQS